MLSDSVNDIMGLSVSKISIFSGHALSGCIWGGLVYEVCLSGVTVFSCPSSSSWPACACVPHIPNWFRSYSDRRNVSQAGFLFWLFMDFRRFGRHCYNYLGYITLRWLLGRMWPTRRVMLSLVTEYTFSTDIHIPSALCDRDKSRLCVLMLKLQVEKKATGACLILA